MNCPKCDFEIDEKMLTCPNCKKVLKLVCPKCKTINQGNLCKKCGFTIIVKCHQCGIINQTINEKCRKCGFSTYSSVAISTSNIDEFACLVITFPNVDEIKSALGSTKLFEKFKANLDKLVHEYAHENELAREIIDGAYVIRFNKSFSFSDSATSAVNGAIEILNAVTELNFKLDKLKNILLQCNIAILKRNINTKPEEYKSGFDIKMINSGKDKIKLLGGLQVITDSLIYEQVCDNFELSTLSSAFVNGQTVMFFELQIKKYVKIPTKKEDSDEAKQALAQLPVFEEELLSDQNDLYNIDGITFDELSGNFTSTESVNIIPLVLSKIQENPRNIISIKSGKESAPITGDLLTKITKLKRFENVFNVTCYDDMKYEPYGFFKEFISNICNFSIAPKNFSLNNFDMFKTIDPSNYIGNLINSREKENSNPEEVRKVLFDIFFNIFASLSGSLIYIEDFDKIDDSSADIMQLFFEKFDDFNVTYVLTVDKKYSIHKNAHFLLSNPYFTEIIVKPSQFKDILAVDVNKYENIMQNHCLEKIAHNYKGSFLYFNQAMDYLLDSEYLGLSDGGVFTLNSQDNIFIPTSLDSLITKRLKALSKDENLYKLLGVFILLGPRVDSNTISLLGITDEILEIQKLVDKNYLYLTNESIFVNNYNLYKDNFLSATSDEVMQAIAKDLLEKVFIPEVPSPVKAFLYNVLGAKREEISDWENLSSLNSSLCDFNAYWSCSNKLLKLIDKNADETLEKTEEEYKSEVYENVSTLLYKFSPDKANDITQLILDNLQKSTDNEKTVRLCNKMLQSCLIDGNYLYAFDLIHKILSKFSSLSANPSLKNFNISYFMLSLVKIEILFSVGNLKDCIVLGEEILKTLTPANIQGIKPEHLSLKQFEEVIFDAMSFVMLSKIILLQSTTELETFIAKVQANLGRTPAVFELFLVVEKLVKGVDVKLPSNPPMDEDKFSKIIINIIKAFSEDRADYKKFADDIYHAKITAKLHKLSQMELLCDLLIGYSYFQLNQDKKASAIYDSVLDTSNKNGLKMITYLDWYFISMLKFRQQDIDVALGIANNSVVQLGKDPNSGNFMFFLFRLLLAEILVAKKDKASAELCLKNAKFIKEKYGLNFDVELDLTNIEVQEVQEEPVLERNEPNINIEDSNTENVNVE